MATTSPANPPNSNFASRRKAEAEREAAEGPKSKRSALVGKIDTSDEFTIDDGRGGVVSVRRVRA